MLSVENRNFNDMRVYVQYESTQRVIMGTVSAFTTRDFKIPDNLLFGTTVLRFVAVSIVDSGSSVSHEVHVTPGDTIVMVIPN